IRDEKSIVDALMDAKAKSLKAIEDRPANLYTASDFPHIYKAQIAILKQTSQELENKARSLEAEAQRAAAEVEA
ncbi:hypothetical protein ACLHTT_35475, partial [Pseudomonas aeruginosa]